MNTTTARSVPTWALWTIAVVITLGALIYQRLVGPTTPIRGNVVLAGETVKYKLLRSHGGPEDHTVTLKIEDQTVQGTLIHKRYKTSEAPVATTMTRNSDGELIGTLPYQPPGGKILYRIRLTTGGVNIVDRSPLEDLTTAGSPGGDEITTLLPTATPVVIRFRGAVPMWIVIPHVLLMFLSMLWSNRAGLEVVKSQGSHYLLGLRAFILLFIGGMIFGPLMQWYAFGEAWTGFPVGHDLTDNKTLIAVVFWIIALIAAKRSPTGARWWILAAAVVTMVSFVIPHSVLGTELDYTALPAGSPAP
jgi:hypothetical protein